MFLGTRGTRHIVFTCGQKNVRSLRLQDGESVQVLAEPNRQYLSLAIFGEFDEAITVCNNPYRATRFLVPHLGETINRAIG